jgi:hypothetical protein
VDKQKLRGLQARSASKTRRSLRGRILTTFGAKKSEKEELLAYNENMFVEEKSINFAQFPLKDELHLKSWKQYANEAKKIGTYEALKYRLPQFQFPVEAGISETEKYRAATRKGKFVRDSSKISGLVLSQPDKLELKIKPTLAGSIPVLIAGNRQDFVTLVQALTTRNEPVPIPDSMGACIVSGYNNWNRIEQYKQDWITKQTTEYSEQDWNREFKRLINRKELYQDRFIILSPGLYSNVSANKLGLRGTEWQKLSLEIRLEHECTHYFTRRLFGSMRNNIFDELIADYRGIVSANGYYRADWFLNFIGLESFPQYRWGGRLENYRGNPSLSEGAFAILQVLIKQAAENLERFDAQYYSQYSRTLIEEVAMLFALTSLTLEELASSQAEEFLLATVNKQKTSLCKQE